MANQTSAAHLPGGSVVVDDFKGKAFYAVGDPGEPDRWVETTAERADSTVDYALRHGAEVVRVGDNRPARPVIPNGDLTGPELAALEAWGRGSADTTGMLYAVRHAVDALSKDARERLARHLYIEGCALEDVAAKRWDAGTVAAERVNHYLAAADRLLAVITGKEA
ncbi:hypothetical protein ABZY58_11350 [Micromonospora tulbaghiae]|uniref:hypothetical protein n=1 Tax=Micromonospora tulbaghiae TaxID=479978 RepID=UPI0033A7DFD1